MMDLSLRVRGEGGNNGHIYLATVRKIDALQVGLQAGEVRVVLGEHSLTVVPAAGAADYTARWQIVALGLAREDRRDAEYWQIVAPLFEEAERTAGSA